MLLEQPFQNVHICLSGNVITLLHKDTQPTGMESNLHSAMEPSWDLFLEESRGRAAENIAARASVALAALVRGGNVHVFAVFGYGAAGELDALDCSMAAI